MTSITQPLRDEHAELRVEIDAIRTAADMVGQAAPAELADAVERSYAFVTRLLIPHATAEERVLYPVVCEAMGAPEATHTMSLDHLEIRRLGGLLGELRVKVSERELGDADQRRLRMILYGLFTLVRVHLEKEEEAYLPLLDRRLTPEQATQMFHRMEAAAAEAKREAASP